MRDIVVTAGTATGSVLALIEAIILKVNCNAYVLCTNAATCKVFASSRFIKGAIHISATDEQSYITEVQNWYKKTKFEHKPILYFTTDISCYYINKNRKWFESNFELCLPSSNIVETFTQKGLAEIKASQSGLSIPKTIVVNSKSDINKIVSDFQFPVILKPRATYLKKGVDFKIKVLENKKEFLNFCSDYIENKKTLLCQEFIPGGNDTSYYYIFYRNKKGEVFENIGRKTLQSTLNGGIMLKGLTEYNQKLSELCKDFLSTIDYHGIGGIEFKKYKGQFYFIEMSVRLEGFYKICDASNTPLSLISYYDTGGLELPDDLKAYKQIDGIIYTDLISTLKYYIKNKEFISVPIEVINVTFNSKSKINIFNKKDFKPFLLDVFNKL
ncbi:ATP-grasp domain-containing protein [Psychrobacter faecalis]